jgi:hypothetical protein
MIHIAIDPGKKGGLAWQWSSSQVGCEPMPETTTDLFHSLESFHARDTPVTVYIEEVGGYVGGKGQPGSAMFQFGKNCGAIEGICTALGFRIAYVRPQAWMKTLGLGTSKGMTKTQWKNKLKTKAQQLFPAVKVTLATADALLILEAQAPK